MFSVRVNFSFFHTVLLDDNSVKSTKLLLLFSRNIFFLCQISVKLTLWILKGCQIISRKKRPNGGRIQIFLKIKVLFLTFQCWTWWRKIEQSFGSFTWIRHCLRWDCSKFAIPSTTIVASKGTHCRGSFKGWLLLQIWHFSTLWVLLPEVCKKNCKIQLRKNMVWFFCNISD